ncbi:MAG TPA: response regulator, partial [Spirochaetota bacterium]|nr:response regulator [Spirochaetota bacterium]
MDSTKIMIVEDEFIIAEDIKDVLTKLGYKISAIAFSGEQALKELEVQLPDLVLMDVMLRGDLDGIDTANQIIQKYKLPVIFLTANTDQATLQRVKSSEAYGYILKPFEQKELYTNIELALYKSRTEKEIIKKHETLQMIADFDETISHLSLNDIVANTFKFIRDRMQIIHSTIIIYDQYRDDYKRFVSDIKEFANQDVIDKGDYKMISKIFFDKVVKSEKTILIKDISAENNIEEKPLNDYLITRGMKSYCTIKLFDKDVFLGCITIFKKEADAISSDTVQILELLSHRLSLSIQNSNLFEDLLESENKFRNFADSLPQIVAEIDFNHRINYANHNALQVFGYGKEDLEKGVFVYDMIRDVDREKYFKSVEDLVNGNGVQGLEFNAQKKDGTIFPVLVYSNIIFRKNIPIGILAILIDISQQKLIEEERIKIKKLESIGILAGGIAHDFNNILTAILGNVSLAKIYTEPDDKVYEILNEAEKACIHSKDLTQQLLTFSKGGLPVKKIGSIKDLITESVQFLLRGSNVKANFKFDEGLHNIEMDEGQINQVINNLTINAIQA